MKDMFDNELKVGDIVQIINPNGYLKNNGTSHRGGYGSNFYGERTIYQFAVIRNLCDRNRVHTNIIALNSSSNFNIRTHTGYYIDVRECIKINMDSLSFKQNLKNLYDRKNCKNIIESRIEY